MSNKFERGMRAEYVGDPNEFHVCLHSRCFEYSFVSRIPLFYELRVLRYTNNHEDPYECVVQVKFEGEKHSHTIIISDNNLIAPRVQYPCSDSWKNSGWGWDESTGKLFNP